MAVHRMTPARRAALKKAQLASARKRKGKGNSKLRAAHKKGRRRGRAIGAASLVGAAAIAGAGIYHKRKTIKNHAIGGVAGAYAYGASRKGGMNHRRSSAAAILTRRKFMGNLRQSKTGKNRR